MYIDNRAIEIFREGPASYKAHSHGIQSEICYENTATLQSCLKFNKISILDHDEIRAKCQVKKWKQNCQVLFQRAFIESTYMKQRNNELYTQKKLNQYMHAKNNIPGRLP